MRLTYELPSVRSRPPFAAGAVLATLAITAAIAFAMQPIVALGLW